MFRSLCKYFGFILLVVIIIIAIRTTTFSVRTDPVRSCRLTDKDYIRATDEVIARFRKSLQFKTISTKPHQYDTVELHKMVDFVHTAFPVIHSSKLVTHDVVNNYSLLYKVHGSNPELRPYMLCAHLDVVPVDRNAWDEEPFGANIKDGFIYARGTIDAKHILMGVLEATEFLLKSGHKPQRTFYIAFGHDEEVTGLDGAAKISEVLYNRGVGDLEFLIDEGTTVVNNLFPGVHIPIAVVGTSEKGSLNVELSVTGTPGHSSMPAGETTIATLARAITRLEENPHPNMFGTGPEKDTFTHLASSLSLPFRAVITNLWLFGPVVSRLFSRIPSLNALVRTVTSVTMVNGGVKVNVLPSSATAMVNHRIHPAQTVEEVLAYDKNVINDERVKLRVATSMEPHPMSPYGDDDFGYQTIKNSIRQIWTNATVVPDGALQETGPECSSSRNSMSPSCSRTLDSAVNNLWDHSISCRTKTQYQVGLDCYIRFSILRGLHVANRDLPPISEQLLIYFVAHCDEHLNLAYTTIKLYLSGIRYFYLRIKGFNPLESPSGSTLTCLHTILTGVKKKQSLCHVSKRTRLPITMSILHKICVLLRSGIFDTFTSGMLEAACTIAFFGFLRCGEFTVYQDKQYIDFVSVDDVICQKTHITITLRKSKTDPFRHGIQLKLFRTNQLVCPVIAVENYLALRSQFFPIPPHPFFVTKEGSILTRHFFISRLKDLLSRLGLSSDLYNGHSFRIGAATTAQEARLEDHLIKTLGRWSSNCYTTYIHTSPEVVQHAQQQLAATLL